MAKKELTKDDIEVGDKVQIVVGGMDITNGYIAKSGGYYVEGGSLWAEVSSITENWSTGGLYGQPQTVVKVRCVNQGIVVYQVQPKHIATNIIKKNPPKEDPKPAPKKAESSTPPAPSNKTPTSNTSTHRRNPKRIEIGGSENPYSLIKGDDNWLQGIDSNPYSDPNAVNPDTVKFAKLSSSVYSSDAALATPYYRAINLWNSRGDDYPSSQFSYDIYEGQRNLPTSAFEVSVRGMQSLLFADYKTSWQEPGRRKEMLNRKPSLIQNEYGFPIAPEEPTKDDPNATSPPEPDLYDYQILIDDPRLKKPHGSTSLEDKLMQARAQLGIPVHGNQKIARSMKYFMYNRFKVPDQNLAHSKSFTYVFFTRPDLNLLEKRDGLYVPNLQLSNHTESALLWKQQPELFKLLTDFTRCGDTNNFNFLLSNQITNFDLIDETLEVNRSGKSWNNFEMVYGTTYSGRAAGDFSCTFTETKEYSIIKLMKLWMTYIDNVSRGAWRPSYNLFNRNYTETSPIQYTDSHVFTKTLDYASAVHVFKCAEDGETVLYWSSYYGVFPTTNPTASLSYEDGSPSATPKDTIKFSYSWKRDMNPISLIEFNSAANIEKLPGPDDTFQAAKYLKSFSENENMSSRPYVGVPYIEMDLGVPQLASNAIAPYKDTTIRLKFKKDTNPTRKDEILYRTSYKLNDVKTNTQTK